jgi:hypothetical protein
VEVVNDLADPTLIQALPEMTNPGAVNLTQYFADTDGDLTYKVEVSDATVVTASVDGNVLSLADAGNASGTETVTVRVRDSKAQANDTFTVTFSLVAPADTIPHYIDSQRSMGKLYKPQTSGHAPGSQRLLLSDLRHSKRGKHNGCR